MTTNIPDMSHVPLVIYGDDGTQQWEDSRHSTNGLWIAILRVEALAHKYPEHTYTLVYQGHNRYIPMYIIGPTRMIKLTPQEKA